MYKDFKELSNLSQTIFARLLTRKRLWYSVRDHLSNYANFQQLQEPLKELIDAGFSTILLHRVWLSESQVLKVRLKFKGFNQRNVKRR